MTITKVNGVGLYSEVTGDGRVPILLTHGSWTSHATWDPVVGGLAQSLRVVTFDRRGHSASQRGAAQSTVHEDVADVGALIEELEIAPAFVAGSSFGASIALRFAIGRPDLVRGVIAHEPPLLNLLAGDAGVARALEQLRGRIGRVVERIEAGDHVGAAEQFVDTVALGPGSWHSLPAALAQTMIDNAPTFLDERNDPDSGSIDLDALGRLDRPVLLTTGDQSPPFYLPIIRILAGALPDAEQLTFAGDGHVPHLTHPDRYVEVVSGFIRRHT